MTIQFPTRQRQSDGTWKVSGQDNFDPPVERAPRNAVHLRDVQRDVGRALISALQFRTWQTNYPDSRPELAPELDEIIADLGDIEKTLTRMEAN